MDLVITGDQWWSFASDREIYWDSLVGCSIEETGHGKGEILERSGNYFAIRQQRGTVTYNKESFKGDDINIIIPTIGSQFSPEDLDCMGRCRKNDQPKSSSKTILMEELVDELALMRNIGSDKKLQNYLRALKEPAKKLWNAYKGNTSQGAASMYFEGLIRDSYLIRYLPFYSAMLSSYLDEVDSLKSYLSESRTIRCLILGGGPGTEILGLSQWIANNIDGNPSIEFVVIDINSQEWSDTRQVVSSCIRNDFPRINFFHENINADLSEIHSHKLWAGGERFDIMVAQNIMNEFQVSKHRAVIGNFEKSLERLRPGGICLLVDQSGYASTDGIMSNIEALARSRDSEFEVDTLEMPWVWTENRSEIDQRVTTNLFKISGVTHHDESDLDGLWLRTVFKTYAMCLTRL